MKSLTFNQMRHWVDAFDSIISLCQASADDQDLNEILTVHIKAFMRTIETNDINKALDLLEAFDPALVGDLILTLDFKKF